MRKATARLLLVLGACPATVPWTALAVDGVVEINQARALKGGVTPADTAGFPVTISVSGSYRLTSDLTVPDANTHAIDISVDHVTIDLNGFSILGPVTCSGGPPVTACSVTGSGMGVYGVNNASITVMNGRVQGVGQAGVYLGDLARVSGVTVRWAPSGGIFTGAGAAVAACLVEQNGSSGILAGDGSVLSGNVVRGNLSTGISGGGATSLSGNTVSLNGFYGILLRTLGGGSTVVGNSISGNSSYGILCATAGARDGYGQNVLNANNGGLAQVSGCTQLGTGTNLCNGVACP